MSNKIKIAVIGVGRWGVHLLRNFLSHPLAEVVAVVDPTLESLTRVKQQFNLDNILLTTDFSELKQVSDLEAVVIATPATTHYSLIHDALKQGYHVLAEKPLTLDPKECLELCHLAEYQKRQLMVDHTYLFHPAVERGRTIVQGSELGDLRYGYATRSHLGPVRQDVDAMWDLAIHDIAIFNTWLGITPVKVQATGTVWLQPGLSDLVWVTLTYANGFQAYIHLCWSNPDKQRRLGVVGSRGSLIFDEMSPHAPLALLHGEFQRQENLFIPINQKSELLKIGTAEPLQGVCHKFVESVINNTPCEVSSGWVGAELVKILAGLRESLNQGGICVYLENFH
ncbi:MAG: Gfo/Idh/MocA family oxidoreductase [Scytonematopsis contorta HA4267-MV1]|jgi:predicted dehydrogenase|nr:Gfo/Idh/MocA family oxidoreductase [Scytonematopsis contorta HA4267-MV1]